MKRLPIDRLVEWAYRDELPKQEASAFSPWEPIIRYGERGGMRVDDQLGPPPRLPAILGRAHPDAETIERAVAGLGRPAKALVAMYAKMGTEPDWLRGPIRISAVRDGSRVRIVGECKGKNRYTAGSYCPLNWSPSPADIEHARWEYAAWYAGLLELITALTGKLSAHAALPPSAPPEPWVVDKPHPRILWSLTFGGNKTNRSHSNLESCDAR